MDYFIKKNYLAQMEFIEESITQLKSKLEKIEGDGIIASLKRDVIPQQIAEQEQMLEKLIKRYNESITNRNTSPLDVLKRYQRSPQKNYDVAIDAIISVLTENYDQPA